VSVNPILKKAFAQGDWHSSLCEQLWAISAKDPSAANLKLSIDAAHCITGVTDTDINRVDDLISGRRMTSWPLFFRLCSLDIAANRIERVENRLTATITKPLGFRQRGALLKFPRVLDYLNQHHHHLLNHKLFTRAERARGLLARSITLDTQLNELVDVAPNGTIALVGNGPTVAGTGAGPRIDDHDVVVRFNNTGITHTYNADIGRESQLWVVSPGLVTNDIKAEANQCAVTGADPWTRPSRYWESVALLAVTQIATFDLQRWHKLVERLGAPPSAGLLMIDALSQAGIQADQVSTYGFSRLENGESHTDAVNHFADSAPRSERHNWDGESALFQQWKGR